LDLLRLDIIGTISDFNPPVYKSAVFLLISAEKTKDPGLAYDDSPFLDKDFAVRLFVKSQKMLLKHLKPEGETHHLSRFLA